MYRSKDTSQTKIYRLFISHMWKNEDNSDYYRLVNLLNSEQMFHWHNYSVPEHDPLGTKTNQALSEALGQRIAYIDCFLVIGGMCVNHRDWIKHEIDWAIYYNKPIVSISPHGQERRPAELQEISREMVGWNSLSIINAIRRNSL